MNYNHITQAYQNANGKPREMNDPHLIVLTMFDALLKSMQIFETNIELKNGGDAELKSKHFARALTIIYALQSSILKKARALRQIFSDYMNLLANSWLVTYPKVKQLAPQKQYKRSGNPGCVGNHWATG